MKQIEGVPESITREAYLALVAGAGFDVKDIHSLEFRTDGIYAEVFERTAEGNVVVDPGRMGVATHRIFIPVVNA